MINLILIKIYMIQVSNVVGNLIDSELVIIKSTAVKHLS